MLIRSVGLLWQEELVFWGAGSNAGSLLGVPTNKTTAKPIDFRGQIGIYALYADYDLVYVGQVGGGRGNLFARLQNHRRHDLAGRWNRFSWFGVLWGRKNNKLSSRTGALHPGLPEVLNHIEAILIHTAEPPMNGQGGRFGENVVRYKQVKDPRLKPSTDSMLRKLCKQQGIDLK